MAPNSPIGSDPAVVSSPTTIVSFETVLASSTAHGGHAIESRTSASGLSGWPGESLSWLQLIGVASFWDAALVVVLFFLISGLVVLRITKGVSTRAVADRFRSLVAQPKRPDDEPDETTQSHSNEHQDEHQAYKQYLSSETPSELLSDEGEVVKLLVANHGSIRQHQIADETGWSKSKVSRICSQMDADGTITKQSVGRENVITLSEPTQDDDDDATQADDVENPLP